MAWRQTYRKNSRTPRRWGRRFKRRGLGAPMEVATYENCIYHYQSDFETPDFSNPYQIYWPVLSQGSNVGLQAAGVGDYSTLAGRRGVRSGRIWWNVDGDTLVVTAAQYTQIPLVYNWSWVIGKCADVEGLPDFEFNPFNADCFPAQSVHNPWAAGSEQARILWSYSWMKECNPVSPNGAQGATEYFPHNLTKRRTLKPCFLRELEGLYGVLSYAPYGDMGYLHMALKMTLHCAVPWRIR